MGKAERIRRMNAREKIAAQQAAARRAETRKRMFMAGGTVLAVLVIVVAFVLIKTLNNSTPASATSTATSSAVQAASVSKQITTVPASTLNSVGKGSGVAALTKTTGQPALTANGKPEILYIGAEYCPYCAAERWAMTVALSRFGTFTGLHYIHSSSTDVYASTPTLSFYKSTYTSKYLTFEPVEMYSTKVQGSGYANLQKRTGEQTTLMNKYDAPPYVASSADSGSFPFVDIGNQYLVIGAQYIPSSLSKLSWAQVATDIRNPSSTVAKDVDGAANSITAGICKIVKNAPASVCNSAGVKAWAGSV